MPPNLLRPGVFQPRNPAIFHQSIAAAPWTPASLSSLVAWWDAANAGSITASGSPATVSQWNDLSGHGYNLTQGAGANQPITGVDTVNGLNALKFDGNRKMTYGYAGSLLSQPNTVYCVLKLRDTTSGQRAWDSNGQRNLLNPNGGQWGFYAGTVVSVSSPAMETSSAHSQIAIFNGASSNLLLDGSSISTSNPGSQGIDSTFFVGGDGGGPLLNADLCELVVQNAAASAGDLSNWATYIARWGL